MENKKLSDKQAETIIRAVLEETLVKERIRADWHSFSQIHPNKYIFQLILDKLSLNVINTIEQSAFVESVTFFPKMGGIGTGINMVFKLHIIFKDF